MNSRRVLFIGGSMDGRLRDIDADVRAINIPVFPPIPSYNPMEPVPVSVEFRTEVYHVLPIMDLGGDEVQPSLATLETPMPYTWRKLWSKLTNEYAKRGGR